MGTFKTWLEAQETAEVDPYAAGRIKPYKKPVETPKPPQEELFKTPNGKLIRKSDQAYEEFDKLLAKSADGFIAHKIEDPWKDHPGFRKKAIDIFKKWDLKKPQYEQIIGPNGWYYNGKTGMLGNQNMLAYIRSMIKKSAPAASPIPVAKFAT